MSPNDTICAIATPAGHGGIGVVRISGPLARGILDKVWTGRVGPENFESRKLYLGEAAGGRAFAVFMEAPHTYTGEDVVEISCHGSPVILRRVLEACVNAGARIARPGEFTRRAFLAGKIDLAQAEAVADVINAANERAARLANDHLKGSLSRTIGKISDEIANVRAEIEASIDFPDEDIKAPERIDVLGRLDDVTGTLKKLSSTFREGRLIRDGARVAIVGAPNAGKSSIFNRLAGHDRAIVHHEAGTTRDVVEETVVFEGIAFKLRDTAGLRDSPGEVEGLGIERTNDEIESADVILAVIDGSKNQEDELRAVFARLDRAKTIFVVNKSDLPCALEDGMLKNLPPLFVSAKTGEGMEEIIQRLVQTASADTSFHEGIVIANARHKDAIDRAIVSLETARATISKSEPPEFAAGHLRTAQDCLGEITGEVTTEEILDRIFSRFCIGK